MRCCCCCWIFGAPQAAAWVGWLVDVPYGGSVCLWNSSCISIGLFFRRMKMVCGCVCVNTSCACAFALHFAPLWWSVFHLFHLLCALFFILQICYCFRFRCARAGCSAIRARALSSVDCWHDTLKIVTTQQFWQNINSSVA